VNYFAVFASRFFVRAAAAALLAFVARAFRSAAVMFAAARLPPIFPRVHDQICNVDFSCL
jgi:hypothetical protein